MINVEDLQKVLKINNCNFFSGVPDSVLKEFSKSLENNKNHIIATNEGSAVSLGIGNYLSTKKGSLHLYAKLWTIKCNKSIDLHCS
jgi:phosphonopyruvate decarboxylase